LGSFYTFCVLELMLFGEKLKYNNYDNHNYDHLREVKK